MPKIWSVYDTWKNFIRATWMQLHSQNYVGASLKLRCAHDFRKLILKGNLETLYNIFIYIHYMTNMVSQWHMM